MNKILLTLFLISNLAMARMGVEPPSQRYHVITKQEMELIELKAVDIPYLLKKYQPKDFDAKPVTFATPNLVSISPKSHGIWTPVPGGKIWNLRFKSENATDVNFGFTKFFLPEGAELYLLSFADDLVYYDGPYTAKDNQDYKQFWTAPLPGGEVAIELFISNETKEGFELELTKVSTGFRDVFKRYNGNGLIRKQGACNNDVVCPVGDTWRDEIRSVAAYTISGTDTCTGTMVMDADRSFKPYFLTAAHCNVTADNAATMVTIWNYESVNCGDLSGGSRMDTVSGSIFKARRGNVDVGLVELSSTPPEAYNVYWAGWDNSGATPLGSVGIHHPGVDEKAISFNTDPLIPVSNCMGTGVNFHWKVDDWEDGTTEPGSSGSGLWDSNSHLLVGFLSGGRASCSVIDYDCYGKISEAWDDGISGDIGNLKPWLDPGNTGVTSVAGLDPNLLSLTADDNVISVCNGDTDVGTTINVLTNGHYTQAATLSTITVPGFLSNIVFGTNPVDPTPGISTLTFDIGDGGTSGANLFTIQAESQPLVNGTTLTTNLDVNILYSSGVSSTVALISPADAEIEVDISSTFSWAADANAISYRLMVSDNAEFSNLIIDEVTTATTFDASGLPPFTLLYWKVASQSACNDSDVESAVRTLTTIEFRCITTPTAIPDNTPSGIDINFPFSNARPVDSVTVSVKSNHTYPGDLMFNLTKDATTVVLMDRPGVPTSTFGCSQDGVDTIFDDVNVTLVENVCSDTSPGIGGLLAPQQPLAGFSGVDISGNWVFNVSDNAGADTGSITELCIVAIANSNLIFRDGFDTP